MNRINSNKKGSRGELEWAHWLQDHGCPSARRTEQYCGKTGDASDVVSDEFPGIHWEVKRTETLQIYKALGQAMFDSKGKKMPIVAHRKSRTDWICILRAEDLMAILAEFKEVVTRLGTVFPQYRFPRHPDLPDGQVIKTLGFYGEPLIAPDFSEEEEVLWPNDPNHLQSTVTEMTFRGVDEKK